MANFNKIENLNSRKLKQKEIISMANECLYGTKVRGGSENGLFLGNVSEKLFNDSTTVYLNSTEELIMKDFISEGDCVATVLGGGDFLLDSIYHGAKDIVTFDINKYQYQAASLKFRAMQKLDYNNFYSFFSAAGSDYLSCSIYEKIKSDAKGEPLFIFWDTIMNVRKKEKENFEKNPLYKILNISDIFNGAIMVKEFGTILKKVGISIDGLSSIDEVIFDSIMKKVKTDYQPSLIFDMLRAFSLKKTFDSYNYSEENYEITKERLRNVSVQFLKSDIGCLKNKLLGSNNFDKRNFGGFKSIYLSNIPEYMSGDRFVSVVRDQLMPLLTDDGIVVYCCQGVDPDLLKNATDEDVCLKKQESLFAEGKDFLHLGQEINDIEGFKKISNLYDVSMTTTDTYAFGNGFSDTDVFVYIKKNK